MPVNNKAQLQSGAAVQMLGICKRFAAVQANKDVDLTVQSGHIHGLVGENGAGKSTLMSILYGFYAADAGRIYMHGQEVKVKNAHDAIAQGVGMVHQHFMLVDTLTALDNVILGARGHWHLPRAARAVRQQLETLMQSTGLVVPLDEAVADLSVGDSQRLEILKVLLYGARILILDEPTAVLTPQEIHDLFAVLRTLAAQGTTIIIITHKLKEVMQLCDAVTVMRAGKVVHNTLVSNTSLEALAEAMIGKSVSPGNARQPQRVVPNTSAQKQAAVLLQATGLTWQDHWGVTRLHDVSLNLLAGEIVGLAGVAGNGQSPLLEILAGLCQPKQGELRIVTSPEESKDTATNTAIFKAPKSWLNPAQARQLGLAHIPENRHGRALVMTFTARENAVLGYEAQTRYSGRFWLRHKAIREDASAMLQQFDVRPADIDIVAAQFSGGNQQKQVIGREFRQAPRVLLIGQPTRGVDIGAIAFIHAQIRQLRDQGCAILLVSSELDEILALADRVVVMNQGVITGELAIADCDETRLGLLMVGDTAAVSSAPQPQAVQPARSAA